MEVSFLQPLLTEEDISEAVRVLRSGWLVLGPDTDAFEREFASYFGCSHGVFVNSCFCALYLTLKIAGIKEGDEVITTPLTYVSTVSPILHLGAKPVFIDVEPETGCIDVSQIEKAITKRTKAILPVHLYGQMIDMKSLSDIANRHGLLLIEDAAHAIEAERGGIKAGQRSLAACFSFHTAKNITAGQGGMIVTNDNELAGRLRVLRRDGVVASKTDRVMEELGYKFLATEHQAAMLRTQLKRIDTQWERRKQLYDRYAAAFSKHGIAFNAVIPGTRNAHHMIIIWVDPARRDQVRAALKGEGIETSVHYNPVHLEPYYRRTFGFKPGAFPITERLGSSAITLPLYPSLTDEQQAYVIEYVVKIAQSPS